VSLDILDASGRLVRRLVVAEQPAGSREVEWDGRDRTGEPAAAGIYFAQVNLGRDRVSKRLILVR
jgi:flagellar hook assembly protein FlgD